MPHLCIETYCSNDIKFLIICSADTQGTFTEYPSTFQQTCRLEGEEHNAIPGVR